MSNTSKKKIIFNIFSENLRFLKKNGFLENVDLIYNDTYICPICLRQFCEADLSDKADNKLTLEHVPPESLGGHGIVLTCAECNNGAGSTYDNHLVQWIREKDDRSFNFSSFKKGKLIIKGLSKPLNVSFKYTPDIQKNFDVEQPFTVLGVDRIDISVNSNHPDLIKEYNDRIDKSNVEFVFPVKADEYKAGIALLKSAYLTMFARFGYSFLFDEVYNDIRAALLDINKLILSTGFFCDEIRNEFLDGAYLSNLISVEGIICLTTLSAKKGSKYRYATHLPIPYTDRQQTLEAFAESGVLSLEIPWGEWNLLSNKLDILEVHNWFAQVAISHAKKKNA